mmetsp:Transcript_6008/g.20192  ORF Transcript_6008/g.20192 Transcript_6008/m.20192 type:complete len:534 (-) Transcript_6008:55-1656(-)
MPRICGPHNARYVREPEQVEAHFRGHGDAVLQVEDAVAPVLGHDHDVALALHAAGHVDARLHELFKLLLSELKDLRVAHHLVVRRRDEPQLAAVHERVPGRVVEVHWGTRTPAADGKLRIDEEFRALAGLFRSQAFGVRALIPGMLHPQMERASNKLRDRDDILRHGRAGGIAGFGDAIALEHVPRMRATEHGMRSHLLEVLCERHVHAHVRRVRVELALVRYARHVHPHAAEPLEEAVHRVHLLGRPIGDEPPNEHGAVSRHVASEELISRNLRCLQHIHVANVELLVAFEHLAAPASVPVVLPGFRGRGQGLGCPLCNVESRRGILRHEGPRLGGHIPEAVAENVAVEAVSTGTQELRSGAHVSLEPRSKEHGGAALVLSLHLGAVSDERGNHPLHAAHGRGLQRGNVVAVGPVHAGAGSDEPLGGLGGSCIDAAEEVRGDDGGHSAGHGRPQLGREPRRLATKKVEHEGGGEGLTHVIQRSHAMQRRVAVVAAVVAVGRVALVPQELLQRANLEHERRLAHVPCGSLERG